MKELEYLKPMSFWELARYYNVADDYEKMHDLSLPWINFNSESCIDKMVQDPNFILISKIKVWKSYIIKERNYSKKIGSPKDFETSLNKTIKIWRGGEGKFNPDWRKREWISFTGDERRVATFSEYNGTQSSNAFVLPTNEKYWVIELDIKINDILLYLNSGGDEEFIIPTSFLSSAKIVKQT